MRTKNEMLPLLFHPKEERGQSKVQEKKINSDIFSDHHSPINKHILTAPRN